MKKQFCVGPAMALMFFMLAAVAVAQTPAPSTITYQGRLALDGLAVNEDCDVVFSLYDAATGGNLLAQVGSDAAPRVVSVRKGLFTEPLDFGAAAFTGGDRWLEIAVRPAGSGQPFSVLTPRQSVTPTPYALHALSGGDVSSLDQAYNKGGPGAGRTINATNGPMSIDGNGGLVVNGNVGIGTQTPNSKLEVVGVVHSTTGGFMFPDGSVQTSAADGASALALPGCLDNRDNTIDNVLCADLEGDIGIKYTTGGVDDFPFALDVNGDIRSVADVYVADQLGIGTTTPADELTITTPTGPDFLAIGFEVDPTGSGAGTGIIEFRTGPGFTGDDLADITVDYTGSPDAPLDLNASVTNDVRLVMGGGKVGIGITPTALSDRLSVNGIIHSATGGIRFPDDTVQTTAATAGGDITEVNTPAGSGLTGGAVTGPVTLNVDFTLSGGINGVATTVARGDHTHNDIGGGAIAVDGSGNVGIGTPPTPAFKLDVAGDIHTPGTISAGAFASNSPFFAEAPAGTPRLRIDDVSGFVSIGSPPNAAPTQRLEVDGNILTNGQFISTVATGTAPLSLASTTLVTNLNADLLDGLDSTAFAPVAHTHTHSSLTEPGMTTGDDHTQYALLAGRAGGQILNGGTAAGEDLTLNGSALGGDVIINGAGNGNLGIGTGTPATTIEAFDTQAVERLITTNHVNGAVLELFNLTANPAFLGAVNFYNAAIQTVGQIGYLGGNQMTFRVNSTEKMRIDENGNLGIGTTTPTQRLDVVGNIQTDSQFISNIAAGTPPLDVDSTTLVTNLNADFLDGRDESEFALLAGRSDATPNTIGQNLRGGTDPGDHLVLESSSNAIKGFVILNPTPVGPLTGSVGIGTVAPTEALEVVGCVKADCFKFAGERPLFISALSAVAAATNLTLIPSPAGTLRVRPNITGVQNVMIPVPVAQGLTGTLQQLISVRVSYRVSSSTTFINATRARTTDDAAGTFAPLLDDGVDRKSNAWTSYDISLLTPPLTPLDINGPLFLNFELTVAGTGSAHDIELGRIVVTVADAP